MKFKNIIQEKNRFLDPKWTMEKLLQKRKEIESDPKYKNPKGGFYKYTKPARRILDNIDWAISHLISVKKKLN